MRVSKILLVAICYLICFVSESIADDFKVGSVDLQRAISESKLGKDAQAQFEEEVKKAQVVIDKKKQEYEGQKSAFTKQRESLNAKAQEERQEKLLGLEKDLTRSFQDSKATLGRRNAQIVSDLIKQLRGVIEQFGKDNGYSLIVEKGGSVEKSGSSILFADPKIDITQTVVKKFDEASKN